MKRAWITRDLVGKHRMLSFTEGDEALDAALDDENTWVRACWLDEDQQRQKDLRRDVDALVATWLAEVEALRDMVSSSSERLRVDVDGLREVVFGSGSMSGLVKMMSHLAEAVERSSDVQIRQNDRLDELTARIDKISDHVSGWVGKGGVLLKSDQNDIVDRAVRTALDGANRSIKAEIEKSLAAWYSQVKSIASDEARIVFERASRNGYRERVARAVSVLFGGDVDWR